MNKAVENVRAGIRTVNNIRDFSQDFFDKKDVSSVRRAMYRRTIVELATIGIYCLALCLLVMATICGRHPLLVKASTFFFAGTLCCQRATLLIEKPRYYSRAFWNLDPVERDREGLSVLLSPFAALATLWGGVACICFCLYYYVHWLGTLALVACFLGGFKILLDVLVRVLQSGQKALFYTDIYYFFIQNRLSITGLWNQLVPDMQQIWTAHIKPLIVPDIRSIWRSIKNREPEQLPPAQRIALALHDAVREKHVYAELARVAIALFNPLIAVVLDAGAGTNAAINAALWLVHYYLALGHAIYMIVWRGMIHRMALTHVTPPAAPSHSSSTTRPPLQAGHRVLAPTWSSPSTVPIPDTASSIPTEASEHEQEPETGAQLPHPVRAPRWSSSDENVAQDSPIVNQKAQVTGTQPTSRHRVLAPAWTPPSHATQSADESISSRQPLQSPNVLAEVVGQDGRARRVQPVFYRSDTSMAMVDGSAPPSEPGTPPLNTVNRKPIPE